MRCISLNKPRGTATGPSTRRAILMAIPAGLLLSRTPTATAQTNIQISLAPSGFKEAMEARDEAMDFKCKAGMMDCDGDRREYAKQQWADFTRRGGAKRKGTSNVALEADAPEATQVQANGEGNELQ